MHTRSAPPDAELFAELTRVLAAGPAALATRSCEPLVHRVENMTTRRIERRRGDLPDGRPWSAVVKVLQPASSHPAFAEIPEPFRPEVLEDLDWRDEPHVYRCGLGAEMPPPLRMPTVLAIADDDEGVAIWMEDVDDVTAWDPARYRRTATALGALAGRWTGDEATARFGLHGRDVGRMFFGKILHQDLPLHAEDRFWADPLVAEVADRRHRRELLHLAELVPGLLRAVEGGATGVCHGDATPDNFREPGDGSIVAVDWSYGHAGHLGSDLGQLVAGRFESGAAAEDDVEAVAATVLDGYLDGLARAGREVDPADVRRAFAVHLAVRSAFSALCIDHRDDLVDDERRLALLRPRARLGRFAIDLALSVA